MKVLGVVALLGLVAGVEFEPQPGRKGIVYRPYDEQMLNKANVPSNLEDGKGFGDNLGRWWAEDDVNDAKDRPDSGEWDLASAQKAYWSYDAEGDGQFTHHNYVVNNHPDKEGEEVNAVYGKDGSGNDNAQYSQNEWNHRMRIPIESMRTVENQAEAQLAKEGRPAKWKYLEPKGHFKFFDAAAANICAPEVPTVEAAADGAKGESMVKGLRRKHNSGSKFQGCSLDDCALTVMYACSFMCTQCEREWCKRECQGFKLNSGSCGKIWDDSLSAKCGGANKFRSENTKMLNTFNTEGGFAEAKETREA